MNDHATSPGGRVVRLDLSGTALFLVALSIAVPYRNHRFAQFLIGGVSMLLFAVGVATTLWAYTRALDRSRVEEVGVANLYLLTGNTAPKLVGRTLTLALVVQVVAAVVGAWIGVVGLDEGQLNALAFGVLVPMFGIGTSGYSSTVYVLAGAELFHLLITAFLGLAMFNRGRARIYSSESNWQVRLVGLWWNWIVVAAVITALTTSFIASPNHGH